MDTFQKSQEIIDISTTYEMLSNPLISEDEALSLINIDITNSNDFRYQLLNSDSSSNVNKLIKPRGVIIQDTFNNIVYPISNPKIDTSKFDLPLIYQYFQEYTGYELTYLPWHFVIDFIKSKYYIFNTRPLDVKFPVSTQSIKTKIESSNIKLNSNTYKFFNSMPFLMEDAIHVAIIGDSSKDIYTKNIYELIGRNCVGPILRYFKLSTKMWQKVYAINVGEKFKTSILDGYLTR